jgi:hypothetical protein
MPCPRYPIFAYNAGDGGGSGVVEDLGGGRLQLTFDPDGELTAFDRL